MKPIAGAGGNPETGYLNCDGSPTKTEVLQLRRNGTATTFWRLCFGKRPGEELYDVQADPDCVNNLAGSEKYADRISHLREQMESELKAQGDPRMFGQGTLFDQYEYTSPATAGFYERYIAGEKLRAGWVSESDFEDGPIDDDVIPRRK